MGVLVAERGRVPDPRLIWGDTGRGCHRPLQEDDPLGLMGDKIRQAKMFLELENPSRRSSSDRRS